MSDDESDPFEGMDGNEMERDVAVAMAAEIMVPIFKALEAKGLSPQEAAALTAALMAQNMPFPQQGPQEGS
jgi:hypothetical protein